LGVSFGKLAASLLSSSNIGVDVDDLADLAAGFLLLALDRPEALMADGAVATCNCFALKNVSIAPLR